MADRRSLSHQAAPGGLSRPGERGETLVEIMATVTLMAFAIVAVLGSLYTMVRVSHMHRSTTTANTTVLNFAEAVLAPEGVNAYQHCAGLTTYSFTPENPQYTARVTQTERLADPSAATASWVPMPASCTDDGGVQRLTLEVEGPADIGEGEEIVVIKRDTECVSSAADIC